MLNLPSVVVISGAEIGSTRNKNKTEEQNL